MSTTRYIIEIACPINCAGVVSAGKIGDLILMTDDPVRAAAERDALRKLLPAGHTVTLMMEETERRRVLAAFNEDHFRRPDRSAGVARAVETPGAKPGFDVAMNEAAAAMKSLTRMDNWLCGDAGEPSAREWGDIADTLDHYGLVTPYLRSCARHANNMSEAEYRRILLDLSATVRAFPLQHVEPVDTDRWLAVTRQMMHHNPDSTSQPNAAACEREADLDFKACVGRVVETAFVNGFDLGTNTQNDHVTGAGEPPYRVVVVGCDDMTSQWNDEDLDPKWDVIPAPDETRLDGLRSLWTFGPSYRDATVSQKQA